MTAARALERPYPPGRPDKQRLTVNPLVVVSGQCANGHRLDGSGDVANVSGMALCAACCLGSVSPLARVADPRPPRRGGRHGRPRSLPRADFQPAVDVVVELVTGFREGL